MESTVIWRAWHPRKHCSVLNKPLWNELIPVYIFFAKIEDREKAKYWEIDALIIREYCSIFKINPPLPIPLSKLVAPFASRGKQLPVSFLSQWHAASPTFTLACVWPAMQFFSAGSLLSFANVKPHFNSWSLWWDGNCHNSVLVMKRSCEGCTQRSMKTDPAQTKNLNQLTYTRLKKRTKSKTWKMFRIETEKLVTKLRLG